MKTNTRLHFASYLTISFSLVTGMALMGTATAAPEDGATNSPPITDTRHMMHSSVDAALGSNLLTISNSTTGDSSEIDLSLLQILTPPQ
jgi:hypothetical protein